MQFNPWISIRGFFIFKKAPRKEAQWRKRKKQNHRQDGARNQKEEKTIEDEKNKITAFSQRRVCRWQYK